MSETKITTAKEAFNQLKLKYPNRKVEAWHWFDSSRLKLGMEEEVICVKVDEHSGYGHDWESAIKDCNPPAIPTPQELSTQLRQQAASLLQKADDVMKG